jgi:hypothetical protein
MEVAQSQIELLLMEEPSQLHLPEVELLTTLVDTIEFTILC